MDQESRTFWFCIFVLFTPVALSPEEPLSRSVLDNVLKEFKERALGNEKETYNRAEQSTYSVSMLLMGDEENNNLLNCRLAARLFFQL